MRDKFPSDELVRLLGPGDDDDARPGFATIERFVAAVRAGDVPDKADLQTLADAFERVLAGVDARDALELRRVGKRGRPRSATVARRRTEAFIRLVALRAARIPVRAAVKKVADEMSEPYEFVEWVHKQYVAGRPSIEIDLADAINPPTDKPPLDVLRTIRRSKTMGKK